MDDGIPLMDEKILQEALQRAAKLHKPVSLHEEDPACISNNGIHAGTASAHFGIGGSPREAEIRMVERDIRIALTQEADLSIQHISTKEAVELVRQAKKKSGHIYAEATPHHFTLTQEAAIKYGTLAKMNPPLREESDRQAIIEGLRDGTIDMIATDHAPHSREEKERPVTEAPSGLFPLPARMEIPGSSVLLYMHYNRFSHRYTTLPPHIVYVTTPDYRSGNGPVPRDQRTR